MSDKLCDYNEWASQYLTKHKMKDTPDNRKNLKNKIQERLYLMLFASPGKWKIEEFGEFSNKHYYYYTNLDHIIDEYCNDNADSTTITEYKTDTELRVKLLELYSRYKKRQQKVDQANVAYKLQVAEKEYKNDYKKDYKKEYENLKKIHENNYNDMINIYEKLHDLHTPKRNEHNDHFTDVSQNESILYEYILSNIDPKIITELSEGYWYKLSSSTRQECFKLLANLAYREGTRPLGYIINTKLSMLWLKLYRPHIYLYTYYQNAILNRLLEGEGINYYNNECDFFETFYQTYEEYSINDSADENIFEKNKTPITALIEESKNVYSQLNDMDIPNTEPDEATITIADGVKKRNDDFHENIDKNMIEYCEKVLKKLNNKK